MKIKGDNKFMRERDLVITCLWRTDEFVISDSKSLPSDDEAVLTIDENTSTITVRIPKHFSLITQRIIERRVSSIAKSGFTIPRSRLRIGSRFEISIIKEEAIPDVLLQVGHHYSYDETQISQKTVTQPVTSARMSPDAEYIPTFLKQDQTASEIHTIARLEPKVEPKAEPEPIEETKPTLDNNETIAGRLAVALTKISDVYFTKKENHYTIEYSAGRVDFTVENGEINVISKKRLLEKDQTLKQAIEAAKL